MTEVRAAALADLDDVVALEARTFSDDAWSPRSIEAEFALIGETRSVFVAHDRGTLVGYAVLMYVGDTADLPRIAVSSEHRRRGIGGKLVDAVIARAAGLGCSELLLEVDGDNEAATALYQGRGFEPINTRPRYYPNGSDAVVMRLPLDQAGGVAADD